MKTLIKAYLFVIMTVVMTSCGKDNYDKPESHFTGKVTYNGQPLGVRGSDGAVHLQFWQDGYELKTSFNVYVTQDGSYSSILFDGVYKLVTVSGRGPWVSKQDTVIVTVNGDTQKDYEVTPYYTLSNISYNVSSNTLTASFDVADVAGTSENRSIEYVALMVNKTQFVDFGDGTHVNWVRISDNVEPGHIEIQLDISNDMAAQKALYARVGLKINGISEGIYDTGVYKIK